MSTDTDSPCVVVGYLKDSIQRRDDYGAVLDIAVGVVYPGDLRAAVLCSNQSVITKRKRSGAIIAHKGESD